MVGKLVSSTFHKKKNDPLYILHCSYQAIRYSIGYIDENCQAAIIFNNQGIYTFGGTLSRNYIFPW